MINKFAEYTTEYISGVMSLRKPQKKSLEILDSIISSINFSKKANKEMLLGAVHSLYPICSNFEREFMSLSFALATGVGKTRLMGAFITYLYTQHNIKNYFVVAPNKTIYEKLKNDLGNQSNPKYVFKSLGCFINPPSITSAEEYANKQINMFPSGINIFVFNIDKFNKENSKMKSINEYLGESFFETLSKLEDLVLIMDESHHYRADRGWQSLNELNPLLGLELTATPLVTKNGKQIPFKNVVYEYPLSKAIADGYTRTPFAITRKDIVSFNFGDEELDKMMICDGILCHERIKEKLKIYSQETKKQLVKPFMLIVCKDTTHAQWVKDFVSSSDFKDGYYSDKTIVIHSNLKSSESDENMALLLDVEKAENKIEIVIHVNMLKEGWDVNNLYTIVPLRTATSKILREQMIGRGLRLPYGERTGDIEIDSVYLTAHDKFSEILEEAQKGESIFKAGNIIQIEDLQKEKNFQPQYFDFCDDEHREDFYSTTNFQKSKENDKLAQNIQSEIENAITEQIRNQDSQKTENKEEIVKNSIKKVSEKAKVDYAKVYAEFKDPFEKWIVKDVEKTYVKIKEKYIPIPKIRITDNGVEEYKFMDFELDIQEFNQVPIENDLFFQNLIDMADRKEIKAEKLDFDAINPKKILVELLKEKPEIDYEEENCHSLLVKFINSVCSHFESKFGLNGMKNVVMMNKREISNKIYSQMMKHFYCENSMFVEEVVDISGINIKPNFQHKSECGLYDNFKEEYEGSIKSVRFTGIKKGVFSDTKFDSKEELILAQILERDNFVKNWLRPAKNEFNIFYNHGKRYEPDFVIETQDIIYLTEVKGENMLNDPDVIAKKNRGIHFCKVVSEWAKANNHKEWRYLFIPSKQINATSSFDNLSKRFCQN